MTQQDKELLLKDLCARLPYGVKVQAKGIIEFFGDENTCDEPYTLTEINTKFNLFGADSLAGNSLFNRKGKSNVKPYLFPLSSMTKEQKIRCKAIQDMGASYSHHLIDRYNEWHLDYRGLIEKGLAINATDKNIY